ncbi:MAG TPA: hypothetical protein VD930_02745 [Gemmatimonadales bacterium]|nr:hypothetical protein [Gemmatimonadales bacterium]
MKSTTGYATLAALVAALACAGNTARTDDPDQSAAARDTTTAGQDTLTGQTENPPGYRGMEQDTTQVPTEQTPTDTFLQNQGTGTPQDTAGYSGMERTDTTGQANQQGQADTTGFGGDTTGVTGGQDTSGMTGADTTTGTTGADTSTSNQSGTQDSAPTGDTTGYDQSQQGADSTNR